MKKKAGRILAGIVILIFAGGVYYVNDYYHSEAEVQNYLNGTESVQVKEISDGLLLDGEGTDRAMIFYPGAKVEYTAYVPLFMELAEQGMDCFLLKMPANLAILGMNRADTIVENYDYEQWFLSGHSLGGAMAASYAAKHMEELSGLVLLAAYSTSSLNDDDFSVLSVYGSEDLILNMEKLEEGRNYMPDQYTEVCIEGGNHAGFGSYGIQKGDGEASISSEVQREQTVNAIVAWADEGYNTGKGEEK